MQEALDCLTYGIQSRKGFILLSGEVGTGKTTLINKLLELLHEQQVPSAFVFNSRLDVPTFLSYMMQDFGIPCDAKTKSKVLIEFYNWLLDRYRAGETAVLIVDEAQNLSGELLEEIRMMTNVESSTEKLLQIVLVGQPELERKLKQPQLRQLRQRITLRARTFPLTLGEMKLYVNQRLRIAGSNGQQLFDPASLDAIYRYSNGIPRVVNLICEQCLVSAFVDQQKVVKAAVVEAVARDFDLDDADNLPPAVPLSLDAPANAPASAPFAIPASKIPRQPSAAPASKADLLDAMKTLNDLAERLRNTEPGPPKKRRP